MPWLLGALSGLVFSKAGAWIAGLMAALGIGLAVQGVVLDQVMDYAQQGFGGLPATIAAWVGFFNVDRYVTLVISGYLGATVKRVILRKVAA